MAKPNGEGREDTAEPAIPVTYSKCLISVLKLARAAWWTPFLVIKSSFSSASVSSDKFTFPSKLKSKACNTTASLEQNELSCPAGAWRHLYVKWQNKTRRLREDLCLLINLSQMPVGG